MTQQQHHETVKPTLKKQQMHEDSFLKDLKDVSPLLRKSTTTADYEKKQKFAEVRQSPFYSKY